MREEYEGTLDEVEERLLEIQAARLAPFEAARALRRRKQRLGLGATTMLVLGCLVGSYWVDWLWAAPLGLVYVLFRYTGGRLALANLLEGAQELPVQLQDLERAVQVVRRLKGQLRVRDRVRVELDDHAHPVPPRTQPPPDDSFELRLFRLWGPELELSYGRRVEHWNILPLDLDTNTLQWCWVRVSKGALSRELEVPGREFDLHEIESLVREVLRA